MESDLVLSLRGKGQNINAENIHSVFVLEKVPDQNVEDLKKKKNSKKQSPLLTMDKTKKQQIKEQMNDEDFEKTLKKYLKEEKFKEFHELVMQNVDQQGYQRLLILKLLISIQTDQQKYPQAQETINKALKFLSKSDIYNQAEHKK